MKKVIARFADLLTQNKGKITHLPSLRPNCLVQVLDSGSFMVNLSTNTVTEGTVEDPDCTIQVSSLSIIEEIMKNPSKGWVYSGRGGKIKVSDNLSAAILLESLFPGTLAATLTPRQFYAFFPNLAPNDYAGHTTEEFFNFIIPQKLVKYPDMLNTVRAAYQFNIDGAGTWTIDLTAATARVYSGPAKTKGSIISTDRKTFEEVLNDDTKAWSYFNTGRIIVSNACRASQVVNAFWPTAFVKGMPGSLYASLFPNETGDPSAPEYNKTTGKYVTYVQGKNELIPINYSRLGDLAIYQGDIILGLASDMENIRKNVEEKAFMPEGVRIINWLDTSQFIWPGGIVYYTKDPGLTNEAGKELKKAMDHWTDNTSVTFLERTTQANYVCIKDSTGCSSNVGMVGGEQLINLNKNCDFGAVVHEIGHTVGLFHEQCRIDRDTYVKIEWNQIDPTYSFNFNKESASFAEDLGQYDYGSIMHYGANAFALHKDPTIITIPAGIPIGQRNGLSAGDLSAIASMYGAKKIVAEMELEHSDSVMA